MLTTTRFDRKLGESFRVDDTLVTLKPMRNGKRRVWVEVSHSKDVRVWRVEPPEAGEPSVELEEDFTDS